MTKIKVNLGIVQETLLIPLWARATELQQADPIICDPKSAEILEAIDYDFDKFTYAKDSQLKICLRGLILDNWVRTYLKQHPQGLVVEIGAELNTHFERVDNGEVRWFDLDLPDSMALRKQFFEETQRRKFITASVVDTDWIKSVQTADAGPCLFIAEAVLAYLSEQQVKQVFANLLKHFPGCWFAFDSVSPSAVKNSNRHDSLKYILAKFTWGISDIRKIKDWNSHYQVMEVSTFANLPAKYLRRFPLITRLLLLYVFQRQYYYRFTLVKFG